MSYQQDFLLIAQRINREIKINNLSNNCTSSPEDTSRLTFNKLITNKALREKTEKLFLDGHYARAVEEAFKFLDNLVKKKADMLNSNLTGATLMQNVFSPKNPKLRLNKGKSSSDQNEQLGYMNIYSGCMTGIRNPRAHDSEREDTKECALQLLAFANHLIERTQMAQVVKGKTKRKEFCFKRYESG